MRVRPGTTRLTTGVLASALLAGCASGPTPQEWTDRMCAAVLPFVRTAVEAPAATDDPAARVRGLSDYLGRTAAAMDRTLGDLDRLGAAPVDGGDRLTSDLQAGLAEIRFAFSGARQRVDALDPADPAAVERGLPGALQPVSRLGNTTGPLSRVTGVPELNAAFRASPACGELTVVAERARAAAPDGAGRAAPDGGVGQGGGG